jgi:hypothetical protein
MMDLLFRAHWRVLACCRAGKMPRSAANVYLAPQLVIPGRKRRRHENRNPVMPIVMGRVRGRGAASAPRNHR